MDVRAMMDDICKVQYPNKTLFSQEFDSACGAKDKLKVLNLLVQQYNCNFDDAQKICAYFVDNDLSAVIKPDNLTPQQIAHNNQVAQDWLNKVHCPYCNSTRCRKISTISKAGSVALFGIFSQKVKKQWHCDNCGSEF